MIQVSDWFKTWMEKQTLNLLRRFIYDDIEESERVESYGSLSRSSDAIISGGTSLALINTDKHWNKFLSDKLNLRREAKIKLAIGVPNTPARSGIARSGITVSNLLSSILIAGNQEWLDLATGWADDPEFLSSLVNLPIRDKFAGLLEKELGSKEEPLNYYSSSYNPADLTWDILTTHGGLDSMESSANPDIDYITWSDWKTACTTANLSLEAKFTGETIREALELIRDLTNSDIYQAGNGKIKFFRFKKDVPPSERYLFDTDRFNNFSVKLSSEKIINYLKVYYGYDPTTETWTGSYLKEDSDSQSAYGKVPQTIDDVIVWHATLASATSYADRRIQIYKNPLEVISFTSFMMGMITEIGDIVRISNPFFGYAGDPYYRVFKVTNLDLGEGAISFEIANFEDILGYSFSTPSVHDKSSETAGAPPIIQENDNNYTNLYSGAVIRGGQKITLSGDILKSVSFELCKTGSPTGTIYARVIKKLDGSIIETSATTYNIADLSTSYEWKSFKLTCAPNEEVRIVVEYSGGNSSNYLRQHFHTVDQGAPGSYCIGYYDDSWSEYTGDSKIKIYFLLGEATNTVDDVLTTYWLPDPANEAGAWISWDMGSLKYIKGCRIYWGSDAAYRPTEYKLWVSLNGTDWSEVVHETEAPPASAWKTYSWDTQEVRYFKLSIITHGSSGTQVFETDEYSIS